MLGSITYTRDPLPRGAAYSRFRLKRDDESNFAVLYIFTYNPNTYHPEQMRHTRHEFVVPVATYNRPTWIRWVYDQILSIEIHETGECFQVDGVRIYSPHHGNGWNPYHVWYDGHPDEQKKAPGDD